MGLVSWQGEVHECHGNSETWQCAESRECGGAWAAPSGFRFRLDRATMRATAGRPKVEERTGDAATREAWGNLPRCIHCNKQARPNILMFNDGGWKKNADQHTRWDSWSAARRARVLLRALESVQILLAKPRSRYRAPRALRLPLPRAHRSSTTAARTATPALLA